MYIYNYFELDLNHKSNITDCNDSLTMVKVCYRFVLTIIKYYKVSTREEML